MNEYFKIGKIAATFGVQGQIVLQHNLGKKTSLKELEAIFIEETGNSFLPYFITSTKIKNDKEVFISLEGIESKEEARLLVKKEVWLNEAGFKKFAAASAPISFLGFMVIDHGVKLGEVLEVIEQPHQVLCRIMVGQKEVLVPLHEDSLEKIDKKNRQLYVNLPDGLLDIYTDA